MASVEKQHVFIDTGSQILQLADTLVICAETMDSNQQLRHPAALVLMLGSAVSV